MSSLDDLLRPGILVMTGSDGVGKTTTSAAIAARAALVTDMRVAVLTIDPARRLANAMGLERLGNRIRAVEWQAAGGRGRPKGQLFAGMLETKRAWDSLIVKQAGGRVAARRILQNPFYREISGAFVGSHEYIAMERLYDIWLSGKYDLVVLDTPPSRNALDFLDAPNRMTELVSGGLLSLLARPAGAAGRVGLRMFSFTAKPILSLADRLLGGGTLAELSDFLLSVESLYDGFKERAEGVLELLADEVTTFLVVTTLEDVPFHEATYFANELRNAGMHLGGAIVNKLLPTSLLDAPAASLARTLAKESDPVLRALGANFLDHRVLALRDRDMLRRVDELGIPVIGRVGRQLAPVHDLGGLLDVAEEVATGTGPRSR